MKYIKKINLIFPIIIMVIFSSCVSQKRMNYLQSKDGESAKTEFVNERNEDYKVQPGDNLYINISSLDEKTSAIFNKNSSGMNAMTAYLNSYTIDDDGTLEFPLAGKIQIQNMTIEEVKAEVQKVLAEYIKEATVIVKLLNFNITMLGEVSGPGQYKVYQDKINLFEAIALAGDMSEFSNRNNIKLIRQTKQGAIIHTLDLTDQNILESDFYYLMPNDIIYVEPLKGKQFAFTEFPYGLMFSTITFILVLFR